jgi:phosphoglycolate phosphatase-like HAD superfamily hydrolase
VAVTWGWHPRERLERAKPDVIIEKPEDLLDCCGPIGHGKMF